MYIHIYIFLSGSPDIFAGELNVRANALHKKVHTYYRSTHVATDT